ncbi:MAG: preprotein translocase subunit YajC [Deltaproteobacteria bacterium]|nr:preprotein translocase subunit YajC [Deltaproteobacteria bacterium]
MLMPFVLMFGVIYFLIIRPQQKKMKEHQETLGKLSQGDEVVTTGGLIGKVTGITDRVLTVEIASNVKVKVLRTQIAAVNPDLATGKGLEATASR